MYVYYSRESEMRSTILIDGAAAAKLKRGTYFAVNTTVRQHEISTRNGVPLFLISSLDVKLSCA